MKIIQGLIEGVIVGAIIIMLAICTQHALDHRNVKAKPVEQGFHCVKVFKIDSKFNVVLKCNEVVR